MTEKSSIDCRMGCGACCVVPSISSSIPGMAGGKSAGERCFQLSADNACKLFGTSERPAVCTSYQPSEEFCGSGNDDAYRLLAALERATRIERKRTDGR